MKKGDSGFTLIEIMAALLVIGVYIIGIIFTLQPGLANNKDSENEAVAANVAAKVSADVMAVPASISSNSVYGFVYPVEGGAATTNAFFLRDDGSTGAASMMGVNFRGTLIITPPGSSQRLASIAHLIVSWPAVADTNLSVLATNYSGAFDSVFTLDRN